MPDVIVVCEGHTEREFCRNVVAPVLAAGEVWLSGTLVGKPQRKRGGIRTWNVYREELLRLAREREGCHVGVLVDYYAMPRSWPGRAEAASLNVGERGRHVEDALVADLQKELDDRFHPCIQMHEFESLLFVDPEATARSLPGGVVQDRNKLATAMQRIRDECGGNVEQIDDSPENAPSKRIAGLVTGYDKVAWGVGAAKEAAVDELRAGCAWLNRWMSRLEALGGN